jgi:hypothetical protein
VTRAWRITVAVTVTYVLFLIPIGALAYCTPTWNLTGTKVLTGWANVVNVCSVITAVAVTVGLLVAAGLALLSWAEGGDR